MSNIVLKKIKEYIDSIIKKEFFQLDSFNEVYLYAKEHGISKNKVEDARVEKKKIRGGFSDGIFCYLFVLQKDDVLTPNYINQPEQYTPVSYTESMGCMKDYLAFRAEKLVRNNVLTRFFDNKRIIFYRNIKGEEFYKALKMKALEEFIELKQAKTKDEIAGEAADLIEVLIEIQKYLSKNHN